MNTNTVESAITAIFECMSVVAMLDIKVRIWGQ